MTAFKRQPASHGRRVLIAALPWVMLGVMGAPAAQTTASAFDHSHAAWDALLKQHVVVAPGGHASTLRYAALGSQHDVLKRYLDMLSAVSMQEYTGWTRPRQLAFLINTYNARTVELVLTRYPQIKSIKDLGSFLQSPWKKKFFSLLGKERSLDELEHEMIRAPGVFDDPHIHVAVVCASVGCPMLRNEAFVAERLDAQLDDAMRRFLADAPRNHYDAASGTLAVSKIFDWYHRDFEQGRKGYDSLQTLFARHANELASTAPAQADVRAGRYRLVYTEYDWSLNDAR